MKAPANHHHRAHHGGVSAEIAARIAACRPHAQTRPPASVVSTYYDLTGRKTAYGDRFDRNARTAASCDFPNGTLLHLAYGAKRTTVRVNDTGPFVGKQRLDVSPRGASDLDMKDDGKVQLKITGVEYPGRNGRYRT